MRRSLLVGICAAVVIALAEPARAQRDQPVTVYLPVAQASEIPDQPTGIFDMAGSSGQYMTLASELVAADLRNDVNFFLDLGSNKALSPRDICVDLTHPSGSAVSRGRPCADMHWNTSDAGSMSAMLAGDVLFKRMQLSWTDPQGTYYLRWGGSASFANWVTVTCDLADAGGCSEWTISNSSAYASLTMSTKKTVLQLGEYRVPVDIKVVAR